MTAPKPKPLGTSIEIAEGASVVRPGQSEPITVSGGLYVLDVPGEHIVDGKTVVAGDDESEPSK
jgi:hypothetical protein